MRQGMPFWGADSSRLAPPQCTGSPLPKRSSSVFSKPPGDNGSGFRGFSTSSDTPPPPGVGTRQPLWYRFRTAITTILVLNAVVLGYTLFRTKASPQIAEEISVIKEVASEVEENEKLKEAEKEKGINVTKVTSHEPSLPAQAVSSKVQPHPELSKEHKHELYKWMLAEKRKLKPANTAEKALIDQEKAMLKQYIRGKNTLG